MNTLSICPHCGGSVPSGVVCPHCKQLTVGTAQEKAAYKKLASKAKLFAALSVLLCVVLIVAACLSYPFKVHEYEMRDIDYPAYIQELNAGDGAYADISAAVALDAQTVSAAALKADAVYYYALTNVVQRQTEDGYDFAMMIEVPQAYAAAFADGLQKCTESGEPYRIYGKIKEASTADEAAVSDETLKERIALIKQYKILEIAELPFEENVEVASHLSGGAYACIVLFVAALVALLLFLGVRKQKQRFLQKLSHAAPEEMTAA